ncbi:MAG: GIY-YIG nuclease family protein [Promethearchaeota archaeon]
MSLSENNLNIFYVYILETVAKNGKKRFYTGYTNNLYRRWNEHRSGKGARFCRGKKSLELKYFETFTTRKEAMRRELEIKTFTRKQKRDLINDMHS